jgi:hypothetical protein
LSVHLGNQTEKRVIAVKVGFDGLSILAAFRQSRKGATITRSKKGRGMKVAKEQSL